MTKLNDLTGKVFGFLTVIERHYGKRSGVYWICECVCGNQKAIASCSLIKGNSKSCGCMRKEILKKAITRHGLSKTVEYKSWLNMITRCNNKYHTQYSKYGGRGIKVCKSWAKFENFLKDMGYKPSKAHTIERINNNKGYSKSNCKWATRAEQSVNRRVNRFLTYKGKTMVITHWARFLGIDPSTLRLRLKTHTDPDLIFRSKA